MLVFINIQTSYASLFAYLFNFNNTIKRISVEWSKTEQKSRVGKACHVTTPADDKTQETEPKAYVGVAVEVVCTCCLNVLLAI